MTDSKSELLSELERVIAEADDSALFPDRSAAAVLAMWPVPLPEGLTPDALTILMEMIEGSSLHYDINELADRQGAIDTLRSWITQLSARRVGVPEDDERKWRRLYQQQIEPSESEVVALCRGEGHPYYSDEWDWTKAPEHEREAVRLTAGRCYCGERRFPARRAEQ